MFFTTMLSFIPSLASIHYYPDCTARCGVDIRLVEYRQVFNRESVSTFVRQLATTGNTMHGAEVAKLMHRLNAHWLTEDCPRIDFAAAALEERPTCIARTANL